MAALDAYFPTLFDDLDGVRVRKSDPLESHLAADSNTKEHRTAVEESVLYILRWPRTDEELCDEYERGTRMGDYPPTHRDSPRKKRSSLLGKGLVEDSGERGETTSGRAAIKWRAI